MPLFPFLQRGYDYLSKVIPSDKEIVVLMYCCVQYQAKLFYMLRYTAAVPGNRVDSLKVNVCVFERMYF